MLAMTRRLLPILLLAACVSTGPPTVPNEREWSLLLADAQWVQTLRNAQPPVPPTATRKQQIEIALESFRKIGPTYVTFLDKVDEYYRRTGDPRAAKLLAREKVAFGDEYMNVLSRYDMALQYYRSAQQLDPANPDAPQRIALAESRRFVSIGAFATVKNGMSEHDVRSALGLPREDWIKQLVQNRRVYSVWIYPKSDGGAAAVYFDNGVVYHTNWNAAAPAAK